MSDRVILHPQTLREVAAVLDASIPAEVAGSEFALGWRAATEAIRALAERVESPDGERP